MSSEENNKVEVMEDEKDIILDHDYDGIKELDHPLPLWWIFIFVGTIVFGVPYYFIHTHAKDAPTIRGQLKEEMAKIKKIQDDYEAKSGGFDVDKYNAFVKTEEAKKMGKKVFKRKCSSCHGKSGEGLIGPNLTDNYWLHGKGKLADVFNVISNGVIDKGMAAWKNTLSEEQLMAVTDYVLKFKGKNVPGKEAQGELIKE